MRLLISSTILSLFLFSSMCTDDEKKNKSNATNDEESSSTIITGQLDTDDKELPSEGATVYLEGDPNTKATTDESGAYTLAIPDKAFDEKSSLVDAKDSTKSMAIYALLKKGGKSKGIQIDDITVSKGKEAEVKKTTLIDTTTIKGKISDSEKEVNGVPITVNGTILNAKADQDGNYEITDVPQGKWNVNAKVDGEETTLYLKPFQVESGKPKVLEEVNVREILAQAKEEAKKFVAGSRDDCIEECVNNGGKESTCEKNCNTGIDSILEL